MPTIAGPVFQMPASDSKLIDERGNLGLEWAAFLHSVQQVAFNLSRSGPTASRPTSTLTGRYVGMDYFDTTLGLKVTLKSVGPDVWVRGDGVAV